MVNLSPNHLRPITAKDLGAISVIEQEAYQYPWPLEVFQGCLRVGYCSWLLEQDARIDAYGILSVAVQEAHLLNLCVRREVQGNGLGARMLAHLLQVARSHDAEQMFLEVRRSNVRALKLYQASGFAQIGVRKAYYPAEEGREDAMVLRCSLLKQERWSYSPLNLDG